jgi:hypothetical protein
LLRGVELALLMQPDGLLQRLLRIGANFSRRELRYCVHGSAEPERCRDLLGRAKENQTADKCGEISDDVVVANGSNETRIGRTRYEALMRSRPCVPSYLETIKRLILQR